MGKEQVRAKMQLLTKEKVLTSIPFDSAIKRTTTVVDMGDGQNVRVYTKGAPDVLFGKDKDRVEELMKQIQRQNPNLKYDELVARAEKQAGYGMVTKVALPGMKT
jgi:magnesium-transporting ATPase (P-type)